MRRSAILISESRSSEESKWVVYSFHSTMHLPCALMTVGMQPSLANDQISSGQLQERSRGIEESGGEEGNSGDVENDSTRSTQVFTDCRQCPLFCCNSHTHTHIHRVLHCKK